MPTAIFPDSYIKELFALPLEEITSETVDDAISRLKPLEKDREAVRHRAEQLGQTLRKFRDEADPAARAVLAQQVEKEVEDLGRHLVGGKDGNR